MSEPIPTPACVPDRRDRTRQLADRLDGLDAVRDVDVVQNDPYYDTVVDVCFRAGERGVPPEACAAIADADGAIVEVATQGDNSIAWVVLQ